MIAAASRQQGYRLGAADVAVQTIGKKSACSIVTSVHDSQYLRCRSFRTESISVDEEKPAVRLSQGWYGLSVYRGNCKIRL